ncbi:MAG TPA: ATP-binding protein [Pyrinomonadaceae bacterium]|jgi:signal transduction histidine kinase|nr:ATP-binding protein [Pyrinomonadaceae bacterium]
MSLHAKSSLAYLPHCLLPLLLLAALNYWNGLKTVDATLGSQAQNHLNSFARDVDLRLQGEKIELSRLIVNGQLGDLLLVKKNGPPVGISLETNADTRLPSDLFLSLTSVLKGRAHCFRLAVFDENRVPLFQIERKSNPQGTDIFVVNANRSQLLAPAAGGVLDNETKLNGSTLQYSVPISAAGPTRQTGTLVGELNLEEVLADAASLLGDRNVQTTFVTVIDPSARIIYHSNRALKEQLVSSALPEFLPIGEALTRNNSGLERFSVAGGQNFITAFSPLPQWNLGLAVGYDRSSLAASAQRWGILGFVVALIGGLVGALAISSQVQRKTRGLERVEEELTAIAKGELDRRIDLKSSDDARAIADNINVMTERLRAQIAREEETRQFQSFVRLSAMLTHDLKNAIEALSLIVGNMERHFDNEEFRLDALRSLTSATDKLKGIVTRLSRPLTSLSGEHPRPKSIDLVPILKRVEAMTAGPLHEKHTVEMKLPPNLFVFADPERIEQVIENLILNALEAMAEKSGTLMIQAGLTSRGAATFSVSDTGPGMSRSFIDNQLFRPFSTTKKNGVGLGLYTCREVLEASAGSIEVESAEGAGTTFRVVLPSASHDSRN